MYTYEYTHALDVFNCRLLQLQAVHQHGYVVKELLVSDILSNIICATAVLSESVVVILRLSKLCVRLSVCLSAQKL